MSKSRLADQDRNGSFNLSLGFRKIFPKDIALSFGINRLFSPKYVEMQKRYENYKYHTKSKSHNETAYLRVSIPFGNQKSKGAQSRNSSSSNVRSLLTD